MPKINLYTDINDIAVRLILDGICIVGINSYNVGLNL
jgi:hypothetical protein